MKTKVFPICSPLKTSIIITSIIGGYMTYIYPRKFVIKYKDIIYDLEYKYIVLFDFIIHQIPLLDMINRNNEIEKIKQESVLLSIQNYITRDELIGILKN